MNLPKFEIRPDTDAETATVIINGLTTGSMWMTDRGCCYKHTGRDIILTSTHIDVLSAIMRGIEAFAPDKQETPDG